jgi:hypothetical protein
VDGSVTGLGFIYLCPVIFQDKNNEHLKRIVGRSVVLMEDQVFSYQASRSFTIVLDLHALKT